jgi:hypothetical protein
LGKVLQLVQFARRSCNLRSFQVGFNQHLGDRLRVPLLCLGRKAPDRASLGTSW